MSSIGLISGQPLESPIEFLGQHDLCLGPGLVTNACTFPQQSAILLGLKVEVCPTVLLTLKTPPGPSPPLVFKLKMMKTKLAQSFSRFVMVFWCICFAKIGSKILTQNRSIIAFLFNHKLTENCWFNK